MLNNDHRLDDDQKLRVTVLDALAADKRFTQLSLRIGVHNGIVHLGGDAPTPELRNQVEQLIYTVSGIRGVVNRIHAPGAPSPSRTITLDLSSASEKASE